MNETLREKIEQVGPDVKFALRLLDYKKSEALLHIKDNLPGSLNIAGMIENTRYSISQTVNSSISGLQEVFDVNKRVLGNASLIATLVAVIGVAAVTPKNEENQNTVAMKTDNSSRVPTSADRAETLNLVLDNDLLNALDRPETYRNYQVKECLAGVAAIPRENSFLDGVMSFISPTIAEAAPLAETNEEVIQCIKSIEAQSPFLSKYGIDVQNWDESNVIGLDTIASWRQELLGESKKRGINMTAEEINAFIGSTIVTTFRGKDGQVQLFTAKILDNQAVVDKMRAEGDKTAHSSGEKVWVFFDKKTMSVVGAFENCNNVFIPVEIPKPSPTVPVEVKPSPTVPVEVKPSPTVPAEVIPSVTATPATIIPTSQSQSQSQNQSQSQSQSQSQTENETATSVPATIVPTVPAIATPAETSTSVPATIVPTIPATVTSESTATPQPKPVTATATSESTATPQPKPVTATATRDSTATPQEKPKVLATRDSTATPQEKPATAIVASTAEPIKASVPLPAIILKEPTKSAGR